MLVITTGVQAVHLILAFRYVPGMPRTRVSLMLLNKVQNFFAVFPPGYHSIRWVLGRAGVPPGSALPERSEEACSRRGRSRASPVDVGADPRSDTDSRGPQPVNACSDVRAVGLRGPGCGSPLARAPQCSLPCSASRFSEDSSHIPRWVHHAFFWTP